MCDHTSLRAAMSQQSIKLDILHITNIPIAMQYIWFCPFYFYNVLTKIKRLS